MAAATCWPRRPVQLDREVALARLKPLFEDPSVLKIGHNLKFDMIVLGERGIDVAPLRRHDRDELRSRRRPPRPRHGRARRDPPVAQLHRLQGRGRHRQDRSAASTRSTCKAATRYAAEDADVTFRLWKRFKARLPAEGATRVYEMVDRPLVPVIARMERHGIKVDRERLAALSAEFTTQIAALETEVHDLAGGPFTIGSPKQLGDVLFERLGLKGGRKGKSGVYSTDVTELERHRARQGSAVPRSCARCSTGAS